MGKSFHFPFFFPSNFHHFYLVFTSFIPQFCPQFDPLALAAPLNVTKAEDQPLHLLMIFHVPVWHVYNLSILFMFIRNNPSSKAFQNHLVSSLFKPLLWFWPWTLLPSFFWWYWSIFLWVKIYEELLLSYNKNLLLSCQGVMQVLLAVFFNLSLSMSLGLSKSISRGTVNFQNLYVIVNHGSQNLPGWNSSHLLLAIHMLPVLTYFCRVLSWHWFHRWHVRKAECDSQDQWWPQHPWMWDLGNEVIVTMWRWCTSRSMNESLIGIRPKKKQVCFPVAH